MNSAQATAKHLLTLSAKCIPDDTFRAVAASQLAADLLIAEGNFLKAKRALDECRDKAADYLQYVRQAK